jgi:hypothetical protein
MPNLDNHMKTAASIVERHSAKAWHIQTAEDALANLGPSTTGLSEQEAANFLATTRNYFPASLLRKPNIHSGNIASP